MQLLVVSSLIATALLAALEGAISRLGKYEAEQMLKNCRFPPFYKIFTHFLFSSNAWEGLLYTLKTSKYSYRLIFGISSFLFFMLTAQVPGIQTPELGHIIKSILLIIFCSFAADFVFTLIAYKRPDRFVSAVAPLGFILCLPLVPVAAFGFIILRFFQPELFKNGTLTRKKVSQKIRQLIEESGLIEYLDDHDRRLLFSLVSFKDAIARKVMVPRIDVFSLSADTTLAEAAKRILSEGYSRIPVYKDNVDDIIGVLLFKDALSIYALSHNDPQAALQLNKPIEEFIKPVLYSPETKKISHLLQEFRSKHSHLAIVVDEWGGTEGIVTIEDILEELVGEIADEYDPLEEPFYTALPSGGWIVDAKMSIIDIEEELGIGIPQSPEYDTLGGYIFHKAGAIPSKGWKIHHDQFDLEVLSSNERATEKIHIKPTNI